MSHNGDKMIICGTGHRPNKLGGYGQDVHKRLVAVAVRGLWEHFASQAEDLVEVISGGALGWDQALADAAIMKHYPLRLYLPFKDFDIKWPESSRKKLEYQIADCKEYDGEVRYVSEPGYNPYKMQLRNEAMVNDADVVLALWNGTPGGTANCIKYANKVGKPVINLWDKFNA